MREIFSYATIILTLECNHRTGERDSSRPFLCEPDQRTICLHDLGLHTSLTYSPPGSSYKVPLKRILRTGLFAGLCNHRHKNLPLCVFTRYVRWAGFVLDRYLPFDVLTPGPLGIYLPSADRLDHGSTGNTWLPRVRWKVILGCRVFQWVM